MAVIQTLMCFALMRWLDISTFLFFCHYGYFLFQDGSTNCQQDSDCPEESDTCQDDPQGKVCYSWQFQTPDESYFCSANDKNYGSWEACLEDCDETECIPIATAFAAENLKTISSTTGQSYRWESIDASKFWSFIHVLWIAINSLLHQHWKFFSMFCCSGLRGVGRISRRCPASRPCPYRSGKCGRLVSNPIFFAELPCQPSSVVSESLRPGRLKIKSSGGAWTGWKNSCLPKKEILRK